MSPEKDGYSERFKIGRVELIPQHEGKSGPNNFSLKLEVEGRYIGDVDYALDPTIQEVSIEWQHIFPKERGKGYGQLTSDALYLYIRAKHPEARIIRYSTDNPIVARIMLKTAVDEDWDRLFELYTPEDIEGKSDFVGFTDSPEVAAKCVFDGGIIVDIHSRKVSNS